MDEQDFKLLTVLSETRNITHAADRLYITQSSVSKRIRQLEQELGITLMLRSRQGIHFTPEGEEVLKHIAGVRGQLTKMRQEIASHTGEIAGSLKLGVYDDYAIYCLPSQLKQFSEMCPKVRTEIHTSISRVLAEQQASGDFDAAILRGEYDWNGKKKLLYQERMYAITSKEYENIPLNKQPGIIRIVGSDMEHDIARWMRENKLTADGSIIYVPNACINVSLVEKGLGWGIVPETCLDGFTGCIHPLYFQNGEPLTRSTYILYQPNIYELPQVKAFVDFIIKNTQASSRSCATAGR